MASHKAENNTRAAHLRRFAARVFDLQRNLGYKLQLLAIAIVQGGTGKGRSLLGVNIQAMKD